MHGIHVSHDNPSDELELVKPVTVAAHGEGRVKILELRGVDRKETSELELCIVQSLPRFFHWILDVRFLQVDWSAPLVSV